jgi:ABC-type uncharacterized transport system YnjBCD substrate-binding protein
MAEKETFILSDPLVEPTEAFLSAVLGEKFTWWQLIKDYTVGNYREVTELWRYYNDGKQWLYRLMQKKNTIFWVAVMADTLRITFYFSQKAEPVIEASSLPDSIKADFLTAKMYGKIKAISIKMKEGAEVSIVCQLVDLKMKMK